MASDHQYVGIAVQRLALLSDNYLWISSVRTVCGVRGMYTPLWFNWLWLKSPSTYRPPARRRIRKYMLAKKALFLYLTVQRCEFPHPFGAVKCIVQTTRWWLHCDRLPSYPSTSHIAWWISSRTHNQYIFKQNYEEVSIRLKHTT